MKAKTNELYKAQLFLPVHPKRKGEGGCRTQKQFKTSKPHKPLVSIITVVYNGEKYIEQTIRSVLDQSYDNIEYLIIDGSSTDRTLKIIESYTDVIDYWVSEPDDGIYDAMNKGLSLCNGEIVGFINADDWYLQGAVETSVKALMKSGRDYSVGKVRKVPSGIISNSLFPLEEGKVYQGMMYPHVSAFIRRNVYGTLGYFNTAYRIAADFDMALRIHLHGFEAVAVDVVVAEVVEGGISNHVGAKREYRMIAVANGKTAIAAYVSYIKQVFIYYLARILPLRVKSFVIRFSKGRSHIER